jgi:Xaa-Pro aminopeptidase
MVPLPITVAAAFRARRERLAARFPGGALFATGQPRARNFPHNLYAFRASSHALYFAGFGQPNAAIWLEAGRATLFVEPPDPDDALWHGPRPSLGALRARLGVEAVRPLAEIDDALSASRDRLATLPPPDASTASWLSARLGRSIEAGGGATLREERDALLADAVIEVRLTHDAAAVAQLRAAAEASAAAHVAGMRAAKDARHEREIASVMKAELVRHGLDESYGPIVTVHGEVLHNGTWENPVKQGDLVLADVGGETPEGWAADITRTFPAGGKFSPSQRAVYEVVLAAQSAAIAIARPGTRYRALHEAAKRTIVEGLVALGVLRGDVDGLLERGAANLFFPHGVGHLLGLDVHDMEDLGDRAGYAPGRARSSRFGDAFLRLDRDLEPGMAVTVEPGFYQVPGILESPELTAPLGADLDRTALARFADVRGIRIEDDVLITHGDPEVLSQAAPKTIAAVEAAIAS